jgi:hypothetical protein
MNKLTKEDRDNLDRAIKTALKGLHVIDLVVWDVIKPYKVKKFLISIKNGMHWEAAYQTAKKEHKPIKSR